MGVGWGGEGGGLYYRSTNHQHVHGAEQHAQRSMHSAHTLLPMLSACSMRPDSMMEQVSKPRWGWSGKPADALLRWCMQEGWDGAVGDDGGCIHRLAP